MASIRDIKKKIGGTKSTQQITRAMKMVATAKLRKAMERLKASQLYLDKLEQIVADLKEVVGDTPIHPLFTPRSVSSVGVVLVAGERGLCGSFNHDLIKATVQLLKQISAPQKNLILIGKKGYEYFKKRDIPILAYHPDLISHHGSEKLRAAVKNAIGFFTQGIIDELIIVYSNFKSPLERKIVVKKMLPLEKLGAIKGERRKHGREMIFDPNPEEILNSLIPRYVEGAFTKAILESSACEHGARMIAMTAATDRADEMIRGMTLQYNRTRQALITKELAEVVAGADALAD
jgi:F-type H+-transporting ATPase subunit gamma